MKNAKPSSVRVAKAAVAMREAAELAADKAKEAMLKSIEESLPEDDDPANGMRQLGSIITAATGMYADMLNTIIAMHGEHGSSQNEAKLAVGCLKKLVAEPLMKVGEIVDGTYDRKD